jgi:hypothetical protein
MISWSMRPGDGDSEVRSLSGRDVLEERSVDGKRVCGESSQLARGSLKDGGGVGSCGSGTDGGVVCAVGGSGWSLWWKSLEGLSEGLRPELRMVWGVCGLSVSSVGESFCGGL